MIFSELESLIGVICGAGLTWLLIRPIQKERKELTVLQKVEIDALKETNHNLEKQIAAYEVEKFSADMRILEQEKNLHILREKLSLEFENLSHRIFQEKSLRFQEDSQKGLSQLLSPLKEKMEHFQKKVEDTHLHDSQQRALLKQEMQNIIQSSEMLSLEANRLGKALRGDVKVQGTWGEIVLEKILESSGLQKGKEYTIQGKGLSLKNEEGGRFQPDVIINLADGKHIVVDAKMSYVHYDRFCLAESEAEKKEHIKKLIDSFYAHVDGLSSKSYQALDALHTPDFVLLFVPIEAIFSLVMHEEQALFDYAWKKSVVLVSPINLIAVLRTIDSLWRRERQNQNAQKIAEEAGKLYDKFADFLQEMEKLGEHLRRAEGTYQEVLNRVQGGRGNLLKRMEDLRALGLKTTRQILIKEREEIGELADHP